MNDNEVADNNGDAMNITDIYSRDSIYFLREMRAKDNDYKLIEKCFVDKMLKPSSEIPSYEVYKLKIYRVKPRKCIEKKQNKNENLLLFHGTDHAGTVGILEQGFKPSISGKYGPGVYLTERSHCATSFSIRKNGEDCLFKRAKDFNTKQEFNKENFVFVNEISNKLEHIVVSNKNQFLITKVKRQHEFEKYTIKKSDENDSVENYEKDTCGRKIKVCNGNLGDEDDYYVCDEKLVIPRYLVQCSTKIFF